VGREETLLFLSHSSADAFEAELLQFAIERLLADLSVKVWAYRRDQSMDERSIARILKEKVQDSRAVIFLVSPTTLESGAAQWVELAYADAYSIPTFVLLHRLVYSQLKAREHGVPPLLLAGQCNSAIDWKLVVSAIRDSIARQS
jgi:hypothetical protein